MSKIYSQYGDTGRPTFSDIPHFEIASEGQDTFNTIYSPESVIVFLNGLLLSPEDITAIDGQTVVINQPCSAGDEVYIHSKINAAYIPPPVATGGVPHLGVTSVSTTTTLTGTAYGTLVLLSGTTYSIDLPASIDISDPATPNEIYFLNTCTGLVNVVVQGADVIGVNNGTLTSIDILPGSTLHLISTGLGFFHVVGGTAQLPHSDMFEGTLASPGYQVLPSGLILQWGSASENITAGDESTAVTFPITFPNSVLGVSLTPLTTDETLNAVVYAQVTASFTWTSTFTGNQTHFWFAIGF